MKHSHVQLSWHVGAGFSFWQGGERDHSRHSCDQRRCVCAGFETRFLGFCRSEKIENHCSDFSVCSKALRTPNKPTEK